MKIVLLGCNKAERVRELFCFHTFYPLTRVLSKPYKIVSVKKKKARDLCAYTYIQVNFLLAKLRSQAGSVSAIFMRFHVKAVVA